ncbi:hypothetical protein HDK77DRAFT_46989 [Phyllosticta capitalensis]|uniref:Uncharacterized protein n=1 Tax=Phyllosticta capitalensis TaxID=121624 RepID=A0ABR1YA91_9PEZI
MMGDQLSMLAVGYDRGMLAVEDKERAERSARFTLWTCTALGKVCNTKMALVDAVALRGGRRPQHHGCGVDNVEAVDCGCVELQHHGAGVASGCDGRWLRCYRGAGWMLRPAPCRASTPWSAPLWRLAGDGDAFGKSWASEVSAVTSKSDRWTGAVMKTPASSCHHLLQPLCPLLGGVDLPMINISIAGSRSVFNKPSAWRGGKLVKRNSLRIELEFDPRHGRAAS